MSFANLSEAATPSSSPSPLAFCADIGGSYIKFGRALKGEMVAVEDQLPTPLASFEAFTAALGHLVQRFGGENSAAPLAISIAGLFDRDSGEIIAANIPCLRGHDVAGELSAALGREVLIANDADSFALAEASIGVGAGHDIVFAVILGTGVGGGLAIHGSMVAGRGGVAGEWGHGTILRSQLDLPRFGKLDIPHFECGCGRAGCTDTIGGARGLEQLHRHLSGEERTSHEILDGWEGGEYEAAKTLAAYLVLLAEPLAFAVNVVGPSIMPVGGGLAGRTALVSALDEALRERTLHRYSEPLLVPGRFQKNGGLVGISVMAGQS